MLARGLTATFERGDLLEGRRWFDAAYRAAERARDTETMANAALGLGGLWVHEQRAVADAAIVHARQSRALSTVDSSSTLGLRLRVRLAGEADYREGGHARTAAVLEEARRSGDPLARAEALSLAHHCVLGPDHGELRHALALELIGESARTGRRGDLVMGMLWRTVDLFLDGDPLAERCLRQLRALLADDAHLAAGYVVEAIEVMRLIRSGRLDEAERAAGTCAERGTAAGDIDATGWYGAQLVAIRWYQGRVVELVPALRDLVDSPTLSAVDHSYLAALAVASAVAGDRRAAAGALARLCGRDLADLPRSSSWLVSLYGAVEAAHLLDDAATAGRAYTLLEPYHHLPMTASLGVACFGSVRHALGVAALTTGDVDAAVHHFQAAVRDNRALGHWPAAALSRARLGEALALRGGRGDADSAREELATATAEAGSLGMALPAAPGRATADRMVCRRQGRQWCLECGQRRVVVGPSVGMRYLATLLANPGEEIRATDLAAGGFAPEVVLPGQRVLDGTALRAYRNRLSTLEDGIDELESGGDAERASRLRVERDWLVAELSAATGITGRIRTFTDTEERARIAVGKAIRRAVQRIARADPVVGALLRARVQTGLRCAYRP
jgi:hypothetical protein